MLSHERHMEHHQDLEKQFTILSGLMDWALDPLVRLVPAANYDYWCVSHGYSSILNEFQWFSMAFNGFTWISVKDSRALGSYEPRFGVLWFFLPNFLDVWLLSEGLLLEVEKEKEKV